MSGDHVLLVLSGLVMIPLCIFRFVRYSQTGLMVGIHYLRMEARREEQPVYFWFIVLLNIFWGALGTVTMVMGIGGIRGG